MKIIKVVSFLLLTFFNGWLKGQSDSASKNIKKIRPVFISIQDIEALKINFQTFDSSLNGIHQLHPFRKQNIVYQDLGLIGTPLQPLILSSIKQPGFSLGFNSMRPWMYNHSGNDEKLIIAQTPYTKLSYSQGANELVFMEVLHSQNISSRWNAGIDFRRLKTNNYLFELGGADYNKVRIPSIYNVKLFSSYRSKSDKYYLLGAMVINKIEQRETGGLKFPSSFDTTSGKRRVFENQLTNARNTINEPAIVIINHYRFGKSSLLTEKNNFGNTDTLGYDFKPRGYFYHKFNASRSIYNYKDQNADTPFYFTNFKEGINDSMVYKEITNSAGIVLTAKYKQFSNLIKAGAVYSNYGVYNSFFGQEAFNVFSIKCDINARLFSKLGELELNGNGQLFLTGYNSGDYLLIGDAMLNIKEKFKLYGQFSSQSHKPDYFQNIGFTTPIKWNQNLKSTFRNSLEAFVEWLPWNLKTGFTASNFQNYNIYFFNDAPNGVDFNYLNIYISNNLKFGKIHWNNRFSYQEVSQTFHLPKLSVSGGLFFENRFFKKNMLARIGIDYYWYSSYFADSYNPYLRQFVWQNKTKIGNYPYFDFYISAQVQTMNLFIRFEHINQGISGNRYYATPHYPNTPRFFRFGVCWQLFN